MQDNTSTMTFVTQNYIEGHIGNTKIVTTSQQAIIGL